MQTLTGIPRIFFIISNPSLITTKKETAFRLSPGAQGGASSQAAYRAPLRFRQGLLTPLRILFPPQTLRWFASGTLMRAGLFTAPQTKKKRHPFGCLFFLVREAGLEPARP